MPSASYCIALASLKHPKSVDAGLEKIDSALAKASKRQARIICFPETYLPGLRGTDVALPKPDPTVQRRALEAVRSMAKAHRIAVILGMEWSTKNGLLNLAHVISATGRVLGYQAKNQITPGGESRNYVPDGKRRIFTIDGVKIGIAICHEGWRYPETVRWAAQRGAKIVFHPQWTGSDKRGQRLTTWGTTFYEKAMLCRSHENAIYFASVNTCLRYQNSATSLIAPDGERVAHVPYGKEQVLVREIDLLKATRFYAKRYQPKLYPE